MTPAFTTLTFLDPNPRDKKQRAPFGVPFCFKTIQISLIVGIRLPVGAG